MSLPSPRALAPLLLVSAALLAGCGGDDEPAAPAASTPAATTEPAAAPAPAAEPAASDEPAVAAIDVDIKGFKYLPETVTVKTGGKVTWKNLDDAPHTSTIAEGAQKFDTGTLEKDQDGAVTFDEAGTYAYICVFHPYMKGTVVVK